MKLLKTFHAAAGLLALAAAGPAFAQTPCAAEGETFTYEPWSGTAPSAAGGLNAAQTSHMLDALDCAYNELTVRIEWANAAEDLDLEIFDENAFSAGSSGKFNAVDDGTGTAFEQASVGSPIGAYRAVVKSYTNFDTAFTGTATATCTTEGGCFAPVVEPPQFEDQTRVVVAVIDSAINPYHSFYYAGGEGYPNSTPNSVNEDVLKELGVPPENVFELTRTGDIAADIAADQERVWDKIQRGQRYHFVGTNIIAASLAGNRPAPPGGVSPGPHPLLVPTTEKSPHGVGTSSAVLVANPEAVILFYETDGALASDASHVATFRDPAVDIVSTSYGLGQAGVFPPELWTFHQSFKSVVYDGKMHFSSGGNAPGFTPGRAGAGPWWSIGVSGFEEGDSEGRTTLSGNIPDFVSDFTQDLARCMDCETGLAPYSGTSFSTPRAAGLASKVLLESRRAMGHKGGIKKVGNVPYMSLGAADFDGTGLTNWVLRRALEQAAHVPSIADYDPVAGLLDLGAQPINPIAPWLQTGWGDLTTDPTKGVVEAALTHLGFAASPRTKSIDFCQFQTTVIQERKVYWDQVSPLVPAVGLGDRSEPLDNDPFIYCESGLPAPAYPEANDPGGMSYDPNADFDGDGTINSEDECPEDPQNACAPDTDFDDDGIENSEDNCPLTPNPDQRDTGGDGVGDACETGPTSDRAPGAGTVTTATYEGSGATAVTPVVGLGAGSGSDGFATFEWRYQLPGSFDYDRIEFVLTATPGTQHSMRIFGPDGNQLALTGSDPFALETGDEAISDGELSVTLENPAQGLYLIQVQEQLGAANQGFEVNVLVTCPDTGCVLSDSDGDGEPDATDAFPNDPSETQDSDGDGVGDNADPCPQDGEDQCNAATGADGFVTAVLTHELGEDGLTVLFDASGSYKCSTQCQNPNNHVALENPKFFFFFRDDTTGDVNAVTLDEDGDGIISHTYGAAGTYTAEVVVRDGNGNSSSAAETVTTRITIDVDEQPDVNAARLTASYDRNNPVVPLEVLFDASLTTTAEGFEITGYTFDFGDGTIVETGNALIQHTYVSDGEYFPEVTVEFTDSDGAKAFSSAKSQAVRTAGAAAGGNDPVSGGGDSVAAPASAGGGSGGLGWLLLVPLALAGIRRRAY